MVLAILPLTARASEAELQVAFVYNFTQFIEWPTAKAHTPFRLCILSANIKLRKLFNQLNGKIANHQVIELVYLRADLSIVRLQSCQLIFQRKPLAAPLPHPLPPGVVLVANNPDPNVSIAMQFNRVNDLGQLRFSINRTAVAMARVKISSQLLKLAIDEQEANKP